ncbi:TPA: type VI secretion system membrane subunit TssM [Salmonella enterica subsp. enterica serovar Paratyphi C]|uniref:Putative inner membrane protein n=1 Tax=Salmonella paratyphi C (strain RKS4594) TaxID=476213 RepID=C0Q6Q2_SALPC|nr:type VI secretion system membrane subunit TssM [Salmonella enterica]EAB5411712.1 type VI secretion system membrane subunit TssM [Salmonella enterica subsp. enterica serovar Paratyphi C]ECK9415261.1 type VI secretion system membrane subunit TssM [Salmonella enterica subsp. enterica serovar Paratyphi C str. CFSAN000604]ACN44481.1 putative inner membrane protein [Salmonella enterica subsp. enterica serovar Paratyphi C str. RKS4594]EBG9759898.1 type VI secretion system membrane subunit TssM [Sal
MQKFLSLLFSRRALAIVGVLVLALLVWFVGPLVSFDTLRPLASVGSRVVTIALLLMLLVLWLVNWSMSIIGISVLCLAIGFVTPLLALGDVHPFAPLWVRLTLIGFILLVYALYGLYRLWRALRMDEQLLRRFLHPRGEEVPVAGEIKADLRTVNHIVTQAIRQLRQLRVDMPGWRKIFEGKRFLYELPWFMVVGSPGDGKTTALLNTGLQFPLAEQMEQTSRILTMPGGGTLHCDWWFTNEAVLIDTAGRYARHDDGGEASAAQRNAGEWQGFLGLLRKHRPGAPLNGVILTLNVADLTAQSPAERLTLRLDQGLDTRLQEEYDLKSRQRLYTFPREFAALGEPLLEAIEQIFLDSKFDATQLNNTLRGVFFTSAAQAQADAVADQLSIWQRFVRAIKTARGESSASLPHALPDGNRSYFLHDLLTQFIFREAHLVEPNLQWAWCYRLLRLGGHLLVLVLAFLLWQGMQTSQQTNGDYLNEISARATRLDGEVKAYTGKPAMAPVPALLDSARELSAWPELDPDAPPLTWRYGLYSVPPVTDSVASLYNRLLDQLLLPPLVKRMEYVLADAIARQDSKAAYDALRIYLLLNLDKDHEDKYNAAEIQSWVINDLGNSDSVAGFGGRAAVLTHIEALFDGSRVVHSPYEKDEALIRQARAFLDGHTSTERIYARALAAMESEAPQEFTLVRAVGADAGTVFVRSNGAPLDRGVPGIFTREGYRELFDKRLPEFVAAATANDGWVMGRESTPKKLTDSLRSQIPGQEQSVAREVRRLYLTEYARRWQDFLDSIHSINSAGEEGSSGLAYDLQVLRTLASPDSPLMRLGKAVVEQTTLVPPPDPQARQKQLAQRASGNAGKVVQTAKLFQDIHPEERLEKTLVDDRFAALREVIAGRTDGGQSGGGTMQIASLLTMLNEYYTQLTIADSALAAGTLPARITAADKLQLEAAKLPAPLKNILLDLTKQGTRKINAGTGDVLNTQMEAMMGDDCRDAIDGRYPFADSPQEVSAEDFNRIFASGGVLDAFWSKQLAPLADTASDPWRYKPTEGNMTLQGPDLTPFQQAKQIRSVFFNSEGGKKFSWSMQISVVDMDPAITELVIDIDGQVLRYAHGPDRPLKVTWPGPRNGSMAEITASPRIRQDTSTLLTGGPWALFHLLDAGMVQETAVRGRQLVEYDFDGRRVVLEITAGRDFNPVSRELLQNFSCPARAL